MKNRSPNVTLVAKALTPSRPSARSVERQDVLELALEIADSEGLAGLTMRKLAERLRVSLATIYSAAGSKEDILIALVDEVISNIPFEPHGTQEGLESLISLWIAAHERLVAHPAIAQLASVQPLAGHAVFRIVEDTLRWLHNSGLDEAAAVHAYTVLRGYLIGFTILRVSRELRDDRERARIETVRNLPPGEFPILQASASQLANQMTTKHFETGLRQVLNGVTTSRG
jgi:TetR/AcrR family tetracycline transcriptional repressor